MGREGRRRAEGGRGEREGREKNSRLSQQREIRPRPA